MAFFPHPRALVESKSIGDNTKIGAFSHVAAEARIGAECIIGDHVYIENDVVIGERVTVSNGIQLGNGLRIDDDVFIGANATIASDSLPGSGSGAASRTQIQKGAYIGANATVSSGIIIGRHSRIGAGAVVSRSVPPHAMVTGNPAQITGYVSTGAAQRSQEPVSVAAHGTVGASAIPGVKLFHLPVIPDMRGTLSYAEYGQYLPFAPKRYFLVFDVLSPEVRGEHAHKTLHQFLVCIKGSCSVMVDNGSCREEYVLDSPGTALSIPPMVWGVQYKFSAQAVLLVLASDVYDSADYIRDYDEFLGMVKKQ
jgi:UDP-2-acetamido-3-amino-2,3-dideoxy-glucuronate N-acetyltransferase